MKPKVCNKSGCRIIQWALEDHFKASKYRYLSVSVVFFRVACMYKLYKKCNTLNSSAGMD